jgi:hypothetical protein
MNRVTTLQMNALRSAVRRTIEPLIELRKLEPTPQKVTNLAKAQLKVVLQLDPKLQRLMFGSNVPTVDDIARRIHPDNDKNYFNGYEIDEFVGLLMDQASNLEELISLVTVKVAEIYKVKKYLNK